MEMTSFLLYEPYKEYKRFIEECRNKIYNSTLILHKHHIIPRSMGGDNSKNNLVKLSVDDHIQAHYLFSKCFEENSYEWNVNLKSIRILKNKSLRMKDEMKHLIQKSYIGENNPFYGKSHSEDTKKRLSAKSSEQWKDKSYEDAYKENAELEKEKRRLGVKKYWNEISDEEKEKRVKKMSASLKGKTPWNAAKNFKYLVDDVIYDNIQEALSHFGYKHLRNLKNNHKVIKIRR